MFNQIALVGVLKSLPTAFSKDGHKYSHIDVEVERSYRDSNSQPIYDTFTIYLWRGISDVITERYPVGTTVGIKGRLEKEDGRCIIMAERVSIIQPEEKIP